MNDKCDAMFRTFQEGGRLLECQEIVVKKMRKEKRIFDGISNVCLAIFIKLYIKLRFMYYEESIKEKIIKSIS